MYDRICERSVRGTAVVREEWRVRRVYKARRGKRGKKGKRGRRGKRVDGDLCKKRLRVLDHHLCGYFLGVWWARNDIDKVSEGVACRVEERWRR
jgi:hypothetical protein